MSETQSRSVGSGDKRAEMMSEFAQTIFRNKYAGTKASGHKEEWHETARRVAASVTLPYLPDLTDRIEKLIREKKFMPGGRYLYAAGKRAPHCNNCFLFRAEDSREGWGELLRKTANSLMVGGGVGVDYSGLREEGAHIGGLGGTSSGPISLAKIVNEQGRYTKQGGSRRSAIWAGLRWSHVDALKWCRCKDWGAITQRAKAEDFNFPAPLDMTNISIVLDDAFFVAYRTESDPMHAQAHAVYWAAVRGMLRTGEPGFSVDIGENAGETLRNAPVHGDTRVLTADGYVRAADLENVPATVWTGKQWARGVVFKRTGRDVPTVTVTMTGGREIRCEPSHPFLVENYYGRGSRRRLESIDRVPASELEEGDIISVSLPTPEIGAVDHAYYTLGFVYGDGSFRPDGSAEVTICAHTKMTCADRFSCLEFTQGKDGRGYQRFYFKRNGLFENRTKRSAPEGMTTNQTASFLAGLFDADGNTDSSQMRIRLASVERGFIDDVARLLETVGVLSNVSKGGASGYGGRDCWQLVIATDSMSRFVEVIPTMRVRLDLTDYAPYRKSVVKVLSVTRDEPADVYCADVGVEEHSFQAEGVLVANCTEVTSRDDEDMCNLGSLNLARFETLAEFAEAVELGTAFLLCGTLYSSLPLQSMYRVREKNRRLGLGLMGVHEWMLKRGFAYGPSDELGAWLRVYAMSGAFAYRYADRLGVSRPVATRAVAPTGTISIVAETTSGAEPIYAVAYLRRYLDGVDWKAQYVVDATAQRLIASGVDPALIEDSMTLAEDVERRIRFQSFLQQYVDHGISSTINLPEWGSSVNNGTTVDAFGKTLLGYLPTIRGITTYPNGARGGQPLNRVPYTEAVRHIGVEFVDNSEMGCKGGVCGN